MTVVFMTDSKTIDNLINKYFDLPVPLSWICLGNHVYK